MTKSNRQVFVFCMVLSFVLTLACAVVIDVQETKARGWSYQDGACIILPGTVAEMNTAYIACVGAKLEHMAAEK